MNFVESVKTCLHKYADFSGRARRSEYWYFSLFTIIVSGLLFFLPQSLNFISTIFSVAILVPSLAVGWRRMHDIGKAGAWLLLMLVPIVGTIIVFIWCCKDSEAGTNVFGPCPKE